jgi:hypothetical protein
MAKYQSDARGSVRPRIASDSHEGVQEDSDSVEAVVQLLVALLQSRQPYARQDHEPQPMLTVAQTAALLGTSRATIIRKADAGELPCVVVSRGTKQKMRRFPQALIEDLACLAGCSSETDLAQFAGQWLASIGNRSGQTGA